MPARAGGLLPLLLLVACCTGSTRRGHTRRIVGGEPVTDPAAYPWFAQLSRIGGRGTSCGAALIGPTWAVTACHCVIKPSYTGYYPASGSEITVGCTDLSSPSCQVRRIKKWTPHPCYFISCCNDHDDLCIAELEQPFQLDSYAPVAGLDRTPQLPVGSEVTLIGMGHTYHHGSGKLRKVDVRTVSKQACMAQDPSAVKNKMINYDNVICTDGGKGKDSCHGDSGSPILGCYGGQSWLLGVLVKGTELPTSGPSCGAAGRYAVYTRIEKYTDFIRATMAGKSYSCASGQCHVQGGSSCTAPSSALAAPLCSQPPGSSGPGTGISLTISFAQAIRLEDLRSSSFQLAVRFALSNITMQPLDWIQITHVATRRSGSIGAAVQTADAAAAEIANAQLIAAAPSQFTQLLAGHLAATSYSGVVPTGAVDLQIGVDISESSDGGDESELDDSETGMMVVVIVVGACLGVLALAGLGYFICRRLNSARRSGLPTEIELDEPEYDTEPQLVPAASRGL